MATILHLPMTELPVVDLGPYALPITNNGCTIDAVNGKFGNGLRFTNAESDHLIVPNHALFDWQANNWTIHLWAYWHQYIPLGGFCGNLKSPAGPGGQAWAHRQFSQGAKWHNDFGWQFQTSQVVGLLSLNHYALVRDGTFVKMYENGSLMTGGSWAHGGFSIVTPTTDFQVGNFYGNAAGGYADATFSEFIIDDTALWTSNFTPPDAPLTYEMAIDRFITSAGSAAQVAAALEAELETIDDAKTIRLIKMIRGARSKDEIKGILLTDT